MSDVHIAIVYHSETGRTKELAGYVAEGVADTVGCKIMSVDSCDYDFLQSCQAIIFGSPTYYGAMSWQMKQFLDQLRNHIQVEGKLAAAFSSGASLRGGTETTLIGFYQALLIMGMMIYTGGTRTGEPSSHYGAAVTGEFTEDDLEVCRKLGRNLAEKAIMQERFGEPYN